MVNLFANARHTVSMSIIWFVPIEFFQVIELVTYHMFVWNGREQMRDEEERKKNDEKKRKCPMLGINIGLDAESIRINSKSQKYIYLYTIGF